MLWTEVTFGVEIECISPIGRQQLANALMSAGIDAQDAGYTHRTTSYWKLVTDGSIQASRECPNGIEVVSPILKGTDGLEQLRKVMNALVASGCKVNASCGLHVHCGAGGASVQQLKNVAMMFLRHERSFDAILPRSRRANNCRWAASPLHILGLQSATEISERVAERIQAARTTREIGSIMNSGDSRYNKINFQSLATHGTVEFRQHSATIDADKSANWVRLLTGFFATAMSVRVVNNRSFATFADLLRKTDRSGAAYLTERARVFAEAQQRIAA